MPVDPKRVQSAFLAVVEVTDPAARDAILDRECGTDLELRQRVEALLKAHDEPGSLLDKPVGGEAGNEASRLPSLDVPLARAAAQDGCTIAPTENRPAPRPPADGPGTRIGPYKLLQPIGEGGMGSVWMAEQSEPVRRMVALKVIKAGMDSALVVARFEAERQALALMDHPHIARVFDGGATDTGRTYFVMELVKGTPITKYCDEHRLSLAQRLELFVSVCQALQHAHQKGIIHRDIKPSNVLVAPYDGRPVVKVIDFGVAKATGQKLTERTLFTEFGAMVGTLQYMSPEQAELNNQDIDTRSDLYSLGVLLYELLTGTTPLDMNRLRGAALASVLMLIRDEEPPKPSTRLSESKDSLPSVSVQRQSDPARLPNLVRGELDCIVMKALDKDRNRRYETANGLARDIERYLADEPVEAQPPSVRYRLKKFVRRNKGPVIAATLVGLALAAGIVGTTWGLLRAASALRAEARQRIVAERERDEKEQARAGAEREKEEKEQARAVSEEHRLAADKAREGAEAALYFNRVGLAYQYWLADNVGQSRRILDACPSERRGWEWGYLDRLDHGELLTLPGNDQYTTALQFSLERKRMAAFSEFGFSGVRIWDLTTNKPLAEISQLQHHRQFCAFALSHDGKILGMADKSGAVSLWNPETGELVREFARLSRSISGLSFSPDGKLLAAACAGRRMSERVLVFAEPSWDEEDLVIWDLASGKEVFHPKGFGAVAQFSPDGSRFLSLKVNAAFRLSRTIPEMFVSLFDTAGWTEIAAGKLGMAELYSFSGDGKRLALGMRYRQRSANLVRIIDPATGDELQSLAPSTTMGDIALSPDGSALVIAEF
ncbi:MAG TPA: protein kinase [Pirellulales bacterium]|nr:protein kinase [Pirellulales bacterium]